MANEGKRPAATTAVFTFALLYVAFTLLTQLPILLSRPIPPAAELEVFVRTGAIVGVITECAGIAALGFAILKKRVWAAWLLLLLALTEIVFNLARQNIINAVLPLILGSLALWAASSLRVQANPERES